MKAKTLLLSLLTIFSCCTCSNKGDFVNKERLTGRYVYGPDTIDVNSDGTYTNYTWWGDRRLENSGTWIYDSLNGRVDFDNFSFLTDTIDVMDTTFVPHGVWSTKLEVKDYEIHFIYASDIYKGYFARIDSVDRRN